MNLQTVRLWKTKLKAAKAEERQWAKKYNEAERALLRVGRDINQLEKKIESELAKA